MALEKGRFDSLTVGGVTFTSDDFFTDVKDDAIRVFTGDRGHSKRIVLSQSGDQAVIELNDLFASYEVLNGILIRVRQRKFPTSK